MAITALGDFFGWGEAQLLASLAAAQKDLDSGSQLIAAGVGDSTSQAQIHSTARERIMRLKKGLYELYIQDNVTYAAYASFDTIGYGEARAVFS